MDFSWRLQREREEGERRGMGWVTGGFKKEKRRWTEDRKINVPHGDGLLQNDNNNNEKWKSGKKLKKERKTVTEGN